MVLDFEHLLRLGLETMRAEIQDRLRAGGSSHAFEERRLTQRLKLLHQPLHRRETLRRSTGPRGPFA